MKREERLVEGRIFLSYWGLVINHQAFTVYFLRYVAYFYRLYVFYAMYHPLLCLAEASRLGLWVGRQVVHGEKRPIQIGCE